MNKNRFRYLFLLITILLVLYPASQVQAKVKSFSDLYMEITLPEDTIVVDKDTLNSDMIWEQIGILDPIAEKKSMKEMGVQAILYDPSTASSVRVLSKRNNNSEKVFHLSLLTEDELAAYLDTIFTASDNNTSHQIEKYEHPELPFYRLSLQLSSEGTDYSEVVYGTIANGYSISFDIFEKDNIGAIDESFIKKLVADTHFTQVLDKAKLEEQEHQAILTLIVMIGIVLVTFIVLFLFRSSVRKKQNRKKKEKAEMLSQFFIVQRQKEDQNIKDTSLFHNRTSYSEELIKTFYMYDRIWKRILFWIATAVILVMLIASFYRSGSIFICIMVVGLVAVFIYQFYSQTEKAIAREVKAYKSYKCSEALYTFYEDYYTLSGIQSTSKYPYIQVTEMKEYKDFIYIYLGSEKAHYLNKDGFENGLDAFKNFMKEHMTAK